MSQSKITTFANEILDKIFAYLTNKDDWFALIKTHRSFRASAQQLLFRENFRNLTSINYKWCTYNPVTYGSAAVKKAGTASQLERLRFTWYPGGHPWMGLDIGIASLWGTRHTLRKLTVLPDMAFGGPLRLWSPATFIDFTALEILRVPALAFFQEVSCGGLKDDPDRAGFELRSDITPLLPPNVRELEIWFKYPSGIFATGGLKMPQFQELSEQERLKWFAYVEFA
ncbi:hypothetical protein J4E91_009245 [Alternaria rosae]|nr:hypothetical protein J4E91_009245 [Alternaria rosae]